MQEGGFLWGRVLRVSASARRIRPHGHHSSLFLVSLINSGTGNEMAIHGERRGKCDKVIGEPREIPDRAGKKTKKSGKVAPGVILIPENRFCLVCPHLGYDGFGDRTERDGSYGCVYGFDREFYGNISDGAKSGTDPSAAIPIESGILS